MRKFIATLGLMALAFLSCVSDANAFGGRFRKCQPQQTCSTSGAMGFAPTCDAQCVIDGSIFCYQLCGTNYYCLVGCNAAVAAKCCRFNATAFGATARVKSATFQCVTVEVCTGVGPARVCADVTVCNLFTADQKAAASADASASKLGCVSASIVGTNPEGCYIVRVWNNCGSTPYSFDFPVCPSTLANSVCPCAPVTK